MHDEGLDEELGPRSPQPKNWHDVATITNGLRDVPVELIARGRIDSEYHFEPTGNCGRLNCPQEHGWGYIVAIPGRRYVSIGHNCADSYAPEALQSMKRRFNDWRDAEAQATSIAELVREATAKRDWLDSLEADAKRGTALCNSFMRACQGGIEGEIRKRAEKGQTRVERQVSRASSAVDAERAMVLGGRVDKVNVRVSRFEVKHLGDFKGLEVFRPLRDPLSLWIRLGSLIQAILSDSAKPHDDAIVRSLQRARRNFGPYTTDLTGSLRAVEAFFTEQNLSLLLELPQVRGQGIDRIEVVGTEVRVRKSRGSE